MKKLFSKFTKNEDGVVSVEFALIAPMMILGSLIALNMGYQVNAHQKATAAVAAGGVYLQDYALENSIDDLRPNFDSETGKLSDTNLIATVKQVIRSAHGDELKLNEIYVNTYCACPTNVGPDEGGIDPNSQSFDFTDTSKDFYTRTRLSLFKKGELCAFDCPENGGRARVIMEVDVTHELYDIFGKRIYIKEKMKSRVR